MPDLLKISATFVLIVVLLRRKVKIGHVMLMSAAFLALLYLMSPGEAIETVKGALIDPVTLKLTAALLLIRVFEGVLREREFLAGMTEASAAILGNRKAAMVSMPLLIGLLPSVGGAYFSAPMVEEAAKGHAMSREEKAFVNYWFRHPWELMLPLYPGVVLASAVAGVELSALIAANLLPAALVAAGGFLLSMKGVTGKPPGGKISARGLLNFVPIASVLVLVLAGLFLRYRYSLREILSTLRKGFSIEVVVLIVGVMLFKETMEASGAVGALSAYFTDMGVPLMPMLFILPFVTGLLTGLTVGFVGATFPLLMSLPGGGELPALAFAFASGFTGVLLSPVHVCLVLTREYFKADMGGIYRRTIPASALVLAGAGALYLVMG